MQRFLIQLVASSLAILAASVVFAPRLRVTGVESAVVFSLVLGLLNALVRPLLLLVTCPLNLITLGLFTLVVNAFLFWLATLLPVGVQVSSFDGAFLGALSVSVVSLLANRLVS